MMRGSPSPSDDFSASSSRLSAFSTPLGMSSRLSQDSLSQSSAQNGERANGAFTLFLRIHSARNLAALSQGSYCKLYVGDSPLIGGFGQSKSIANLLASDRKHAVKVEATYRSFHTKVQFALQKEHPEWNEKFEVKVFHPATEILTIRVKSQVMLYSPAIGACAIHLRQLGLGETVDQWFPLYKNDKPAGHIRLQLRLQANASEAIPQVPRESSVKSAAMQRLIQEHREQEDARKLELQAQQEQWQRAKEAKVEQEELGREERWREQSQRQDEAELQPKLLQEEEDGGCDEVADSDDGIILQRRNVDFAVEEATASKLMSELSLRGAKNDSPKLASTLPAYKADDGVSSYDAVFDSSNKEMRRMGTKRLSIEDLNQVVHNALPSSDSSESTSSEEERERLRRERKHRKEKKSRRRKHKHSRRRFSSEDEYSQSGSDSSTEYRRAYGKSNSRVEKHRAPKSSHSSMSSRSRGSNQSSNDTPRRGKEKFQEATSRVIAENRRRFSAMDSMPEAETQPRGKPRRDTDTSLSLTYPSSPSEESSSAEERRRRRRHKEKKARMKEKRRKHRSRRKHGKSRRDFDSDDSSSSSSLSSSSSSSTSEDERRRRKLKKKAKRKAQLSRNSGLQASQSIKAYKQGPPSYADLASSRSIDCIPPPPTHRQNSADIDNLRSGAAQQGWGDADNVASMMYKDASVASSSRTLTHGGADVDDSVVHGFSEVGVPAIGEYLDQAAADGDNDNLTRSFFF